MNSSRLRLSGALAVAVVFLSTCGGGDVLVSGSTKALTAPPARDSQAEIGRLSWSGNGQTWSRTQYDRAGQVVATIHQQEQRPAMVFVTTYGYLRRAARDGELGNVPRTLLYPDGETVATTYDLGGEPQAVRSTPAGAAVRDIVKKTRRDARGQVSEVELGDGTVTSYRYNDEAGRPRTDRRLRLAVTRHGTRTLQGFEYRFDAIGNLTEVASLCPATANDCGTCNPLTATCTRQAESACYRYDDLDRLVSVQTGGAPSGAAFCAGTTQTYEYDAIGNLTRKEGVAQAFGFDGQKPHAIRSWGTKTLTLGDYDPNGNLLRLPDKVDRFVWNGANMPVFETGPGGTTRRSYLGEALWKRVTSAEPVTYYLPGLRVEGDTVRKFYGQYAERATTAASAVGTLRFYHGDHLGSSTLVTSADGGQILQRASFTPYGSPRSSAGSFTPKHGFNFEEKQTLTGLYDYGARLYNPETGRWISPDSSSGDGLNRYAYVGNNPLGYVDPTGHDGQPAGFYVGRRGPDQTWHFIWYQPDADAPETVLREDGRLTAAVPQNLADQGYGYVNDGIVFRDRLYDRPYRLAAGGMIQAFVNDSWTPPFNPADGPSGWLSFGLGAFDGMSFGIRRFGDRDRFYMEWAEQSNPASFIGGALAGGLVMGPWRGPGAARGVGKAIALGKDIPGGGLKALAEATGASWWRNWARDGITRRTVDRHFGRAFHQAVERAETIHFSLDGINDVADAVRRGAAGFKPHNFTNAELHYIVNNPGILAKTIFYRGGVPVVSPF